MKMLPGVVEASLHNPRLLLRICSTYSSSYYPHVQIPLRSFELKLVKYVEFNQKYDIDQNKAVSVFVQQVCKSGLNRKFCKDLK